MNVSQSAKSGVRRERPFELLSLDYAAKSVIIMIMILVIIKMFAGESRR